MAARSLRAGELAIVPMPGAAFLDFADRHGRSGEVEGRIRSQYREPLEQGAPSVGALALSACGSVAGAISWGRIELPREPGTVGGRVDVVVTRPDCRGLGIGRLLVAEVIDRFVREHGDRLRSFSVIAIHPAIARIAEELAFEPLAGGDPPLYTLRIEPERLGALTGAVRRASGEVFGGLRMRCVACRRQRWSKPWCASEEELR